MRCMGHGREKSRLEVRTDGLRPGGMGLRYRGWETGMKEPWLDFSGQLQSEDEDQASGNEHSEGSRTGNRLRRRESLGATSAENVT